MELAQELSSRASVQIDNFDSGISVSITPVSPTACSFGWADISGGIWLQVGDQGGRWELEDHPKDLAFLAGIAQSIIADRVHELWRLDARL